MKMKGTMSESAETRRKKDLTNQNIKIVELAGENVEYKVHKVIKDEFHKWSKPQETFRNDHAILKKQPNGILDIKNIIAEMRKT